MQQLVVPVKFRSEVLRLGHASILAGHLGIKKTTDRILINFFWPGVFGDIRIYCQSCDVCQRAVGKRAVQRASIQPMPLVHTPFENVVIGLIGPLSPPTSKGNRWILTLVDFATRYPEAIALTKTDTDSIAEALLGIFSRVGLPTEILSDNGPQFVSSVMKEVARLASMRQMHSSPYHPQANGLCEKFNGTLKKNVAANEFREAKRLGSLSRSTPLRVPRSSPGEYAFLPFRIVVRKIRQRTHGNFERALVKGRDRHGGNAHVPVRSRLEKSY